MFQNKKTKVKLATIISIFILRSFNNIQRNETKNSSDASHYIGYAIGSCTESC